MKGFKRPGPPVSMLKEPIPVRRRRTLHEQIVEQVRMRLLDGSIPPGARIPETALCGELDISRTPLREALKVLASEGLVSLLPHRGAVATDVNAAHVKDLFQVLVALERLVGEVVVAFIDEQALVAMELLHARMQEFHERRRRADYFRVNQQIHLALVELTGNDMLIQTYLSFSRKALRARALANLSVSRWDESAQEHEIIMDALRRRDGAALSRILGEHSARTGEAVAKALAGADVQHRAG